MNDQTYDHDTTLLCGLPVIIKWKVQGENRPATLDCPAEYEEITYEVCDRTGRHAEWIRKQMTLDDRAALLDELRDELDGMCDESI